MTRSRASRPTGETGSAGSSADRATDSANGTFLRNSRSTSFSSSGKLKPLTQSRGSHSSSGSMALAVWQVVISGVYAKVPKASCMCSVVSPLVV